MTPEEQINKPEDERKNQQRASGRFLIIGTFVSLGVVGLLGAIAYFFSFYSGDTPVVLIGGSVTVKEAYKNIDQQWNPPSNDGYSATLAHPIESIALKMDSTDDKDDNHRKDDGKSTTDLQRVDVPKGASWQVDVYTVSGTKVASIKPGSSDIELALIDTNGCLSPKSATRRVEYYTDSKCTSEATLAKAIVTVNGNATPLNCAGSDRHQGYCRIVLRYSWHLF